MNILGRKKESRANACSSRRGHSQSPNDEVFVERPPVFLKSNPFDDPSLFFESCTRFSEDNPFEEHKSNSLNGNSGQNRRPVAPILQKSFSRPLEDILFSPRKPDDDNISVQIQKAIHHREYKELKRLVSSLEGKRSINASFEDGQTALHFAAWTGRTQAVLILIKAGAKLDARDRQDGSTALHKACFNGTLQIVNHLLSAGADMSTVSSDGKTALHMACWEGHPEVVRLLTDRGADVHATDDGECTPLHYACMGGHLQVVEYILYKRANPRAADKDRWTPLHYACYFGMIEIVSCLLEHGASIHDQNQEGERPGWSFYDTVGEQNRLSVARCLGAHSVKRSVEEQECTVCMDGPKDTLMAPCGHDCTQ